MIIIVIFIIFICIVIIKRVMFKKFINNINEEIDRKRDLIEDFFVNVGASYDEEQDIICSSIDSWQRNYGYCKLYDKLAWILYMSIDCEPIYFKYENKIWLIEFWKGQYMVATGCEIGIYVSDELDLSPEKIFFYTVDDKDMIDMEFVLKKGDEILFKRREKHWWLTGFRFGEYSNPNDLSMEISLNFKNYAMFIAFVDSLEKIGYKDIYIKDSNVSLLYSKPKTKQCFYRRSIINYFIQIINYCICKRYNKMVKNIDGIKYKLELIKKNNINMYIKIIRVILNRKVVLKSIK